MDGELTIAILREIRDEIRTTNSRIDALDRSLGGRIDGLENSMSTRMDRIEHVVRDLAEQMLTVTRYVKNVANRHDEAIDDLRERVGKLETRGA